MLVKAVCHRRGQGLRQIKHLPQSPVTGHFFITTFGIAFYQSNLSTSTPKNAIETMRVHDVDNRLSTKIF